MTVKKQPKKRFSDNQKVLAIVAIAIILIVMVLATNQPQEERPAIADKTNTEVFSALFKGGITSSNTIVEGDTVKVTYQLPPGMEKEKAELYILGSLSTLIPNKQKIIISSFLGKSLLGSIEVSMSDVLKYKNEEITVDQLKALFKSV